MWTHACVKSEVNVRYLPQFFLHIIFEIVSIREMFNLEKTYI